MQQIHEYLRATFAWYDTWHRDAHSSAVSWGVFLLVALFFTFVSIDVIENQAGGASVVEAIPQVVQKDPGIKVVPPPFFQQQIVSESVEKSEGGE